MHVANPCFMYMHGEKPKIAESGMGECQFGRFDSAPRHWLGQVADLLLVVAYSSYLEDNDGAYTAVDQGAQFI